MTSLLLAVIYLSFISLGLPDPLLGSAWPSMYGELNVPVSFAGLISMTIALGTVVSSLMSDRLTLKFGAGLVTAVSVASTALALFGFSVSRTWYHLILWSVPYGLGAGSVDASLNNYVALHYKSRHMSWLHCMWGVGCSVGPVIMGRVLTAGQSWNTGYRLVSILQLGLTAVLFLSLPLWKRRDGGDTGGGPARPLTLREIFSIPGVAEVALAFFCYCSLETAAGLWAGSYLALYRGLPAEEAATLAGLFYIGITVGRALSGFATMKLDDVKMVRLGLVIIAAGIVMLIPSIGIWASYLGFILIGLGCAPVYPCLIHSTPDHFGASRSQAIIGVQMASAYVGTLSMPAVFGLIANHITPALLPFYLAVFLVLMLLAHERLLKKASQRRTATV